MLCQQYHALNVMAEKPEGSLFFAGVADRLSVCCYCIIACFPWPCFGGSLKPGDRGFDRQPLCPCQSVLERDAEPRVAPDSVSFVDKMACFFQIDIPQCHVRLSCILLNVAAKTLPRQHLLFQKSSNYTTRWNGMEMPLIWCSRHPGKKTTTKRL